MLSPRYLDQKSSSFEYSNSIISLQGELSPTNSFSSYTSVITDLLVQNAKLQESFCSIQLDPQDILKLKSKEFSKKHSQAENPDKKCIKCSIF